MTREEIRKKWRNGESGIDKNDSLFEKISRNAEPYLTKNRMKDNISNSNTNTQINSVKSNTVNFNKMQNNQSLLPKAKINNAKSNSLINSVKSNNITPVSSNSNLKKVNPSDLETNLWDKIKLKSQEILNDSKNAISNFGLGVSSSAKKALYYIQNTSEHNNTNYKLYNQTQARFKHEKESQENVLKQNGGDTSGLVQGLVLDEDGKLVPARKYESLALTNIDRSIKKDEEKIQENIENSQTKVGKKVAELMPSIGQSTTGMAMGMVNPVLGLSYFQTSAGGSYTREAKAKGMNDEQAFLYGTIMGSMESVTESIGAKLTEGVGKAFFKEGAKSGLKALGLDIGENFLEEAIMEPIQEVVTSMTGGEADWNNIGSRMFQSGIDGALSSIIMGGASAGIGKATQLVTKMQSGERISQKDIADTLKAINESEEVDIEKLLVNSFQFTAQDLMRNSDVQNKVNNRLDKVAQEINQFEGQNIIQNKNINKTVKNQQATINNEQVLNNNQQVISKDSKIAQNQTSEQINNVEENNINNEVISDKISKNNYKNQENAKTFLESASKNNLDISSKEIETISKLLDNRNLNGTFDENAFNGDTNKGALYVNGNVVLNPKADTKKGLYDLVIHETSHSILENAPELRNTVLETLKSDSRYEQMYNDVASRYSEEYKNSENFQSDIEEEMISDYLGENLSTEDFINRLSEAQQTKNQSKIKQVIDNFIQKIKDFFSTRFGTGIKETDSESYYWNKVEDLFYDAYLNTEIVNSNSKYSLETTSDGIMYVKDEQNKYIKSDGTKMTPREVYNSLVGKTIELGNGEKAYILKNLPNKNMYNELFKRYPKYLDNIQNIKELNNNVNFNIEELLSNSDKIIADEQDTGNRHQKQGIVSFDTRTVNFYDGNNAYTIDFSIAKLKDGNKVAYAKRKYSLNSSLTQKIKAEETRSSQSPLNQQPLSNNSIPSSNKNVKNGTTKYSIQENEKNTKNIENSNRSSFSLPQKADTKYSQETTGEWNKYLKDTSRNKETRKTIEDVKLPQNKKAQLPQINTTIDEDIQAFREETDKLRTIVPIEEEIANGSNKTNNQLPDTKSIIVDKKTKPKTSFKEVVRELRKKVTNKGVGVDELFKATGNKQGTYKYDRTLSAFNEAQVSIGLHQVDTNGQVVGDSLLSIYDQADKVGIDKKSFDDYLLNKNNIARFKWEKSYYGESITSKDNEQIVANYEKRYSQIKELGQKISEYNRNNLKILKGTFITDELYNKLIEMYPDYVPAIKDIVETPGLKESDNLGHQLLKKAIGGDGEIISPAESMAGQTVSYIKAFRRNEALKEVYKSLKSNVDELYNLGEIVDLDQAHIEIENAVGYDDVKKTYTATIFENGNAKVFKISKDIYDSFVPNKAITDFENNSIVKVLGGISSSASKGFKALTTGYNPLYAFKNMIRDLNDAPINSKYTVGEFLINWGKAYNQIINNGKYYQEYINAGGGANTYFDYNEGLLPTKTKNPIKKIGKGFIDRVKSINRIVETAPRLAEYMLTRKNGGSIDEALYNSAEVTTNFKRGGEITKVADKYAVPFLNASVQGLSKQFRNLTGQNGLRGYANLVINSAVAGILPSVLNHLLLDDDEDYEKLEDYLKDNYYLIKVDNDEQNFIRIPKGRVAGLLGATAVRTIRKIEGEDKAFDNYFSEVIWNNIGVNNPITNNLFAPLIQASNNEAWFEGNIYSESKYKNMLPVEITDEKTDKLSNEIGKILHDIIPEKTYKKLSEESSLFKVIATPKLLNYVLDQYSGFVGDFVLPMLTPYAENNTIIDQFTTSSILKNKAVSEFYEMLDNNYQNSQFATDSDKLTYQYLSSVSKEVGELYGEKSNIQNDNSLSNKEKREQTYSIQEQINNKMEEAIDKVKEMKLSDTSASFNGTDYYKDEEGNWKKIEDDEKVSSLSTEVYGDYKNKLSKANKQKKISTGNDNAQLTEIEKINLIKDSTYSDEEKRLIYSNYINKDNTEKIKNIDINSFLDFKSKSSELLEQKKIKEGKEEVRLNNEEEISILLNNNNYSNQDKDELYCNFINTSDDIYTNLKLLNNNNIKKIDDYLQYKTADLESDKKDNGTKKGKTISGSKKKKIINYIKNSKFNTIERLYLYGTNYELDSKDKKSLWNYVEALGLTYKQKKNLLLKLKGSVEMSNGDVNW